MADSPLSRLRIIPNEQNVHLVEFFREGDYQRRPILAWSIEPVFDQRENHNSSVVIPITSEGDWEDENSCFCERVGDSELYVFPMECALTSIQDATAYALERFRREDARLAAIAEKKAAISAAAQKGYDPREH